MLSRISDFYACEEHSMISFNWIELQGPLDWKVPVSDDKIKLSLFAAL